MIEGSKCDCGKSVVPIRDVCSVCGSKMVQTQFKGEGKVLTHTMLFTVSSGFQGPLGFAVIELKGGPNVLCRFETDLDVNIEDIVLIQEKDGLLFCEVVK